jgi:hypothetical protein
MDSHLHLQWRWCGFSCSDRANEMRADCETLGSGALSHCHAWNSLQVRREFNVLEAGRAQQISNRGRLAVADFESDEAASGKARKSLRDEAAINVEPVGAGKERQARLVIADLNGKR